MYELELEALQLTLENMDNRSFSIGKVLGVWPTEEVAFKAHKALAMFLRDNNIGTYL